MGNLKLTSDSMKKPPLGLVPMHALVGVCRVLEDSGIKYTPGNFMEQAVSDAVEAYDSAEMRHRLLCTPLSGIVTPETYAALDSDSGLPHLDHMIAGLLILRTLMIRDGVLPEDPGMGNRKRASVAPVVTLTTGNERTPIAPVLVATEPHARVVPRDWSDCAHPIEHRIKGDEFTAERCGKCYYAVYPERVKLGDSLRYTAPECLPPEAAAVLCKLDDTRKAEADAHVEQLAAQAREAAEIKRKWENRCMTCNGKGKFTEYDHESTCSRCNGTGQKTGAEGMSW